MGGQEPAGAEGADDFIEHQVNAVASADLPGPARERGVRHVGPDACPPTGSITNASTCSGPIWETAASSAAQLASAAASALGARKVSGAGIFTDSTASGPHSAGPASNASRLVSSAFAACRGVARVRVRQPPALSQHRLQDPFVALPEIRQERARADVKQTPPLVITQVHTFTGHDRRQITHA